MSERESADVSHDSPADVAALARTLLTERVVGELLDVVVSLAYRAIGPADGAGVTMKRKSSFETAGETEPWVRTLDHVQYQLKEGPCLAAIEDAAPIRVPSLVDDARFSRFGERAAEFGVLSALSMPLANGGNTIGALNLYSRASGQFSAADETLAGLFAQQALSVLEHAGTTIALEGADQLQQALRSREVIGQAIGIMMEREACSAEEAFDRLRKLSQNRNIKLRELAQRVIESRKGDTP